MTLLRPAALALALVPSFTFDAVAQAPDRRVSAEDRTTIAACVRESGEAPRACIGAIAVVCARPSGGNRQDLEVTCSRRETAVWRERLDVALGALAQRLDSGPRSRLASVQRSWEAYAAQKCALAGELQTPSRAAAMQAGCELREVALRSFEIERMIRQQGRTDAPPRLER